ncbi:MAG: MFS transporter [Thermodesulfobacteriota bacterium]
MNNHGSSRGAILGIILLLTGIFLISFLGRVILGPLLPVIEKDLGLSHTGAGSLFLVISLGYFLTLAGSGLVSSRLGHRLTIFLSVACLGLALFLLSLTSSLPAVYLALLGVGLATGLYLPSAIATITTLVSPDHWGKALAIHELAPNLGLILAPIIVEVFFHVLPWPGLVACLGGLALVAGLVFLALARLDASYGEIPSPAVVKSLAGQPSFWIMMVLFSLGVSGSMGTYTILPLYLVTEAGFSSSSSNLWISASRVAGLLMAFAAGWLSDRVGPKATLRMVTLACGLSTLFMGLFGGQLLIAALILQAAMAAAFFPPAFAALSKIGRPGERNVVVSCTVPLSLLFGGGVTPAFIGYMGEAHTFALGVALVGGLIAAGSMLVSRLVFREENPVSGSG